MQGDVADQCPTPEPLESSSETSRHQVGVLRTSTRRTGRVEGVSPTREVLEHPVPWEKATLAISFGSTSKPRDQALWRELCSMTDYETGQVRGDMGTPEDPFFTYEEAVCQR